MTPRMLRDRMHSDIVARGDHNRRMRDRIHTGLALLLAFPALLLADDEREQDEIDREEGIRCIQTRSIRSTDVLNDSNIVFRMQGNRYYHNTLPRRCNGLSRERRFSYTTHSQSLCANDLITILSDSGFGMLDGRSCRLGRFRPTTKEDIADFKERMRAPPKARPPEPPPPQEVIPDDDELKDADEAEGL